MIAFWFMSNIFHYSVGFFFQVHLAILLRKKTWNFCGGRRNVHNQVILESGTYFCHTTRKHIFIDIPLQWKHVRWNGSQDCSRERESAYWCSERWFSTSRCMMWLGSSCVYRAHHACVDAWLSGWDWVGYAVLLCHPVPHLPAFDDILKRHHSCSGYIRVLTMPVTSSWMTCDRLGNQWTDRSTFVVAIPCLSCYA